MLNLRNIKPGCIYLFSRLYICLWKHNKKFAEHIGGGESPTFITSNSEEESKIKFYFLQRHCSLPNKLN